MLTFSGDDGPMLANELASTGITYATHDDTILIAPGLRGHSPNEWNVCAEAKISDVVQLLRLGDVYVGIICSPITPLIYQYLNSYVPEDLPASFISDIIDLYIADLEVPPEIRYGENLRAVWEVHERAREITTQCGYIPRQVVRRIKHAVGDLKETVH